MTVKTGIRHLWDVKTPMRDGVELSSDVYLPPGGPDGGPYPVILHRIPYDNQMELYVGQAVFFAEQGYAAVIQDVRGRNDSEGVFYPFHNEGPDGYDTIEWIASQPWSTGKIGMMGGSYGAWVQWAAAREQPPHLTTLVSSCSAGRWGQETPYRNGLISLAMFSWFNYVGARAMQNNSLVDWGRVYSHLPLRTMDEAVGRGIPAWQDWLDHPTVDEYWKQILFTEEDFSKIDLPVLHLTGWYDGDQEGTLYLYDGMIHNSPAKDKQHLIVGPWEHKGVRFPKHYIGEVDFSVKALVNMTKLHLRWFDQHLKGIDTGILEEKRTRYFLMGVNRWIEDDEVWPPEALTTPLFLHSDGGANTSAGNGSLSFDKPDDEPFDEYVYDPDKGIGGAPNFFPPANSPPPPASLDRRRAEQSDDVLVYTSDLLDQELTVVGTPFCVLHAASDCPDTDWVVALSDVWPDGRSIHLVKGLLRARYRESLEKEVLMEPGKTYEFNIELTSLGHVFKPGHRIRLSVNSSAFPLYDRNLNTGNPVADDTEIRVATNRVFHSSEQPSHLLLPVLNPVP